MKKEKEEYSDTDSTISTESRYSNTSTYFANRTTFFPAPESLKNEEEKSFVDYKKKFINPKHIKMSKKMMSAPYVHLFLPRAYNMMNKWLKLECSASKRKKFHHLCKTIAEQTKNIPKKDMMAETTVDQHHSLVVMYGTRILTEKGIFEIAAWLRKKATEKQKNEFKDVFADFQTYRNQRFGISTAEQNYSVIPKTRRDKKISTELNDVARKEHFQKVTVPQMERAREKSRERQQRKAKQWEGKSFTYSMYKESFRGEKPRWKTTSMKPENNKAPYGVLGGRSLQTTNRSTHCDFGRGGQRLNPKSKNKGNNKASASIGQTIGAPETTDEDIQRLKKEIEEAKKQRKEHDPTKPSIGKGSSVKMGIQSLYQADFQRQAMYNQSERMMAKEKKRLKVPFAESVTGYALKSQLTSEHHGQFTEKANDKELQITFYNKQKLPSHIQPAVRY